MEFNIQDLSKEDLDRLEGLLWTASQQYEPWADMMMLGGAGDPGVDSFPLDLDQIERIDVTVGGAERPQESIIISPVVH
jgi:hypothetical protein